jgi:hypothetical protein
VVLGGGWWSAVLARGALYVGTLGSVDRVEPSTGALDHVLDWQDREVVHNHSLAASGDRVAFVCGGTVFVLGDDGAFAATP